MENKEILWFSNSWFKSLENDMNYYEILWQTLSEEFCILADEKGWICVLEFHFWTFESPFVLFEVVICGLWRCKKWLLSRSFAVFDSLICRFWPFKKPLFTWLENVKKSEGAECQAFVRSVKNVHFLYLGWSLRKRQVFWGVEIRNYLDIL